LGHARALFLRCATRTGLAARDWRARDEREVSRSRACARITEMTKIKETGWENRENVFFHRFCGHKHLFRLHQPRFPRARIYRIDYPDSN
jgi:hypothetical protein